MLSQFESALLIACEKCHVSSGIPCCTSTGRRATWPHSVRTNTANQVWLAGYYEGLREAVDQPALAQRTIAYFDRRNG